jgi:hypothetical protein
LASVRRTFAPHLPLYVCALLFVPMTALFAYVYRTPLTFEASEFFLRVARDFVLYGLFLAALVQFGRLAFARSRSPLGDFGAWAYRSVVSHDRPGNIVHSLVTITPLMISFSGLKEIIPVIHSFVWDPAFEEWDRVIGFGHAPWTLLQPLAGYPVITGLLDIAYSTWFIVIFSVLIWQAFFAASSALRMQYLLAFSLSWFIAGNVLAVVFASVGPCFYGFIYSPDPYAAQMSYLHGVNQDWPLASLRIQDELWQSYAKTNGANLGISAMPSMHVVSSVLTALIAWRSRTWLGVIFGAYAAIVVVGSVHLAFHYALDAIAGILLALIFWVVAGKLVQVQGRLPAPRPAVIPAAAQPQVHE